MGHNFVSGLRTLKSKNLKNLKITKKTLSKSLGFFQPWNRRLTDGGGRLAKACRQAVPPASEQLVNLIITRTLYWRAQGAIQ